MVSPHIETLHTARNIWTDKQAQQRPMIGGSAQSRHLPALINKPTQENIHKTGLSLSMQTWALLFGFLASPQPQMSPSVCKVSPYTANAPTAATNCSACASRHHHADTLSPNYKYNRCFPQSIGTCMISELHKKHRGDGLTTCRVFLLLHIQGLRHFDENLVRLNPGRLAPSHLPKLLRPMIRRNNQQAIVHIHLIPVAPRLGLAHLDESIGGLK